MKIGAYNPQTGDQISDNIYGLNFGNVQKGKHSSIPILVRPEIEDESIIGLEMYLQNNGGFEQTQFGYFKNSTFVPVKSCDPAITGDSSYKYISDHLTEVPNPPNPIGGVPLNVHEGGFADFVWLDVHPSLIETGGSSSINYRFIFEYS